MMNNPGFYKFPRFTVAVYFTYFESIVVYRSTCRARSFSGGSRNLERGVPSWRAKCLATPSCCEATPIFEHDRCHCKMGTP